MEPGLYDAIKMVISVNHNIFRRHFLLLTLKRGPVQRTIPNKSDVTSNAAYYQYNMIFPKYLFIIVIEYAYFVKFSHYSITAYVCGIKE